MFTLVMHGEVRDELALAIRRLKEMQDEQENH